MELKTIFIVLVAFIFGIVCTLSIVSFIPNTSTNKPSMTTSYVVSEQKTQESDGSTFITKILGQDPPERPSPWDRVSEDSIKVEKDKVVINIPNAEWSKFTDTNSMDPVLDVEANAIQVVPQKPDEIHIGDIVSYKSEYADGTIIHRVTEIGYDEKGWYCTVKGDNNPTQDPGKIRFSQIKRVVVAIIY